MTHTPPLPLRLALLAADRDTVLVLRPDGTIGIDHRTRVPADTIVYDRDRLLADGYRAILPDAGAHP